MSETDKNKENNKQDPEAMVLPSGLTLRLEHDSTRSNLFWKLEVNIGNWKGLLATQCVYYGTVEDFGALCRGMETLSNMITSPSFKDYQNEYGIVKRELRNYFDTSPRHHLRLLYKAAFDLDHNF